jgi:L-alanine-DL-glutamate epimerase-like enolase superfamily enzyme
MPESTKITALEARAYGIPTDAPEADGTFAWDRTTLIVVHAEAGGQAGLGYTYSDAGAAGFVAHALRPRIIGRDAFDIPESWARMGHAVRNIGRPGFCATAIAAVDAALWDLKAKLLGVPLFKLLGAARETVPVYGSGGFTSYPDERLAEQLGGWAAEGLRWVKMKVGTEPERDVRRVRVAREAIGTETGLFVDANGAYSRKEALGFAERFAEFGVRWFEEPVSSDDLEGLRLLRDRAPGGMEIAAGEYGYTPDYFRRMLAAGAVDTLQADATRCLGMTGFLLAGALCEAHGVDLSGHCAPALHLHVACATPRLRHLEWFHDHVRIEHLLFDGAPTPRGGVIRPDPSRTGNGLEFKHADAERFAL